jgi:hypothetical protein
MVMSHDMLQQFEFMRNEIKELRAELTATKKFLGKKRPIRPFGP